MALSTPTENNSPASSTSVPTLVGNGKVAIKPKYKIDLAKEYDVHRSTMCEMCKHIGITGKKKLTIKQVLAVYNHYGYPGDYGVQLGLGGG